MLKTKRMLLALSIGSALAPVARAQSLVVQDLQSPADQTSAGYWSAQRMQNAKPVELPKSSTAVSPSAASPRSAPATAGAQPTRGEGSAPTVPSSEIPKGLKLAPALTPQQMQQQHGTTAEPATNSPEAKSQFGLPFTTSEVQPTASQLTYPFSTAGKLFFTEQGVGDFVCSAAALRPNIVVTAGHCVAYPSTNASLRHFYTNWLFVPAYNNGAAPYGQWIPSAAGITGEWYGGDGSVPNAQDVGMLVMQEQSIGGTVYRLGDIVGWLGYSTQSLAGNQVTMLGYPCNLDNCAIMERTDAGNSTNGGNNTEIYGSASGGGASGGPWIQDFGTDPVSTGAGNQNWPLGLNYLVAVTSYGPSGTQGYLGASILDSSFLSLLNTVCGLSSRNC